MKNTPRLACLLTWCKPILLSQVNCALDNSTWYNMTHMGLVSVATQCPKSNNC